MHRLAVFARNHEVYLKELSESKNPSRQVTFQSKILWLSAAKALETQGPLTIFLSPIDGGGIVKYKATVNRIVLNPTSGDPKTEELLALRLQGTEEEGLWGKTLYTLSQCKPCLEHSLSGLQKWTDGSPLSDNFSYSYARVRDLDIVYPPSLNPDEIEEPGLYFEGAMRSVTVNAYERNWAAREACLKHYGTNCAVCGFNFGAAYGEIGAGFIHVHHLRQLASIKDGYQVDPINDLRPVCPNCHAMLHRHPQSSIDELKAQINASYLHL